MLQYVTQRLTLKDAVLRALLGVSDADMRLRVERSSMR